MADTAEKPAEPRAVSRFEYNLLTLLRFALGHAPREQAVRLAGERHLSPPPCLSRNAAHLVKDSLAKGLVLFLVRAGGWRDDRFLRGDRPVGGRVWQRVPLDERRLQFGPAVPAFLLWLTADKPTEPRESWDAPAEGLTPAEELFFALALDAFRADTAVFDALRQKDVFRRNPLCWVFRPADFASADHPDPPAFDACFGGVRAAMLECLQPWLARRWTEGERAKGQVADWRRMRQQGRAEDAFLAAFLPAAERAGRTDLARFVLRTAGAIFQTPDLAPAFWTGGLHGAGPPRLADRLDTQRAALALARHVATLQGWDRRARAVGYFDEGYAASQLWKEGWEAAGGDEIAARARRVLEQLEPLRPQG